MAGGLGCCKSELIDLGCILGRRLKKAQTSVMFVLDNKARSLLRPLVFTIAAMLVVVLAGVSTSRTANAQFRIGIGLGGIGGVLFNDPARRPAYQGGNPNAEPARKPPKAKYRQSAREEPAPAKRTKRAVSAEQQPKANADSAKSTSAPTKSTSVPRSTVGTSTSADKFGD
jgi:hypothetical protein